MAASPRGKLHFPRPQASWLTAGPPPTLGDMGTLHDLHLGLFKSRWGAQNGFQEMGQKREKMCLKEIIGLLRLAHIERK